jgi:hypothetical protein
MRSSAAAWSSTLTPSQTLSSTWPANGAAVSTSRMRAPRLVRIWKRWRGAAAITHQRR